MIKVTVIIPVYNGKDYINRCIDSVLKQSLKDIQIIVVNDGSTDSTLEFLTEYDNKNENLTIINIENSGQGIARNIAIKKAKGKYLYFMDSDDYLHPDILLKMYKEAEYVRADLVVCPYYRVDQNGNVICIEMNKENAGLLDLNTSPWNKLFRRDIWVRYNIKYAEKLWYEDLEATLCYVLVANNIVYLSDPMYYYVQRSDSSINKFDERIEDIFQVLDNVYNFSLTHQLFEKYYFELEYFFMMHLIFGHLSRSASEPRFFKRLGYIKRTKKYLKNKFPNYHKNKYFKISYLKNDISVMSLIKWIGLNAFQLNLFNFILTIYQIKLKINPSIKRW